MTELMDEWMLKGDVVTNFTLQLSGFINDFIEWHASQGRASSIFFLGSSLDQIASPYSRDNYDLFRDILSEKVSSLKIELTQFLKKETVNNREMLLKIIYEFSEILGFHERVYKMFHFHWEYIDQLDRNINVKKNYEIEFQKRYNEFVIRYECFLKEAGRALQDESIIRTYKRAPNLS